MAENNSKLKNEKIKLFETDGREKENISVCLEGDIFLTVAEMDRLYLKRGK